MYTYPNDAAMDVLRDVNPDVKGTQHPAVRGGVFYQQFVTTVILSFVTTVTILNISV